MIAFLLTMVAPADAAPAWYHSCSGVPSAFYDFCGCMNSTDSDWVWWGQTQQNIDDGYKPMDRPANTCFDTDAILAASYGTTEYKQLSTVAAKFAGENDALWTDLGASGQSVILWDESESISSPQPPVLLIPIGVDLWRLEREGELQAEVFTGGQQIVNVISGDWDDNGLLDFVFWMSDGSMWESMNNPPNQVIVPPM
ncbi:MAG: hypothetical protein H6736_01430 [Alphaproteobacteria bacterium]|nr:hypothetical protein [Alphaproteobacteria bacterium]MCB9690452.1 hypothetical protein [Alphaproteobacteria bacterium]